MSEIVRLINLTDTAVLTEDELLDRAREGDKSAFGTLYLRHRDAARKVAGMCASSAADAEDAVAEGFARVFAALPRMSGRSIAFRPYLLTCVRNAATDRLRRERRIDLRETLPETPASLQADDVALLGLERNLVGEALQALPSRWRTVLWLTEVEGLSPAEVSRRIGIKPNAVAALAYRARKGLREAYLQAHLRAEASQECRATVSRLGNYVRGDLAEKERLAVQAHLDECGKCRCRRDELTDVNATLRNALIPVPLLLASMQRRWFNLGQVGGWWAKGSEVVQAVQATDSPLAQKALAGLTMVALAVTGTTVPKLMDTGPSAAGESKIVLAAPARIETSLVETTPARPGPLELAVRPVLDPESAGAPALSAAAAAPSPAAHEEEAQVGGGTQSRLLGRFNGKPGENSDRQGQTRHQLLDPGSGDSDGDLLSALPVGDLVNSALNALAFGDILPLGVSLSLPVLGQIVGAGDPAGGLSLNVTLGSTEVPIIGAAAPADQPGAASSVQPATSGAPASGPAGSEPAAGSDQGLLGEVVGLLEPVTGLVKNLLQ